MNAARWVSVVLAASALLTAAHAQPEADAVREDGGADERSLRLVVQTGSGGHAVWHPDGTRVLTWEGNSPCIWDAASGRLIVVLHGHAGSLGSASFSPDGSRVVTASGDGTARVWDADSGKEMSQFQHHNSEYLSAGFSPDGARVVTASWDNTARVWDALSGQQILVLDGHAEEVTSTAFSPGGARIVTASEDGTARVWEAAGGQLVAVLEGHEDRINSVAFSPDGTRVVTASDDETVRVWDAASGRQLAVLEGHATGGVTSAAFSSDGARVVTVARWSKFARVWDAASGRQIAVLEGHTDEVLSAAFSPNGGHVVTASLDDSARVWDAASGRQMAFLEGHAHGVASAAFSPDGTRVVTASLDNTARVWDVANGRHITSTDPHASAVACVTLSSDGVRVVTANGDSTARLWGVASGRQLAVLEGHTRTVESAAFSPDGARVVTASWEDAARVWDVASGRQLAVLEGQEDRINSVAFSPDGARVVTASDDDTARVWDAASGLQLAVLKGHTDNVNFAAFSPDGTRVVTASWDNTARVWDAASGLAIAVLTGHQLGVWSAAFSPDGARVVTASSDETARVWDANSGRQIAILEDHTGNVHSAAFSPEGSRVVTASWDSTARVWDAASGRQIAILTGHAREVWTAIFSPDGARVVTAGWDNTSRVWEAASGRQVAVLEGHTDEIRSVAFFDDAARVVTASADGSSRIWDATTGREIARLYSFTDGSWAVIEPGTGRYDAGPNGASTGDASGLHWVANDRVPIALEQFKDQFWDPGLLAKLLGRNQEPLREVPDLKAFRLYPAVELDGAPRALAWGAVPIDRPSFTLRLTDQGGGIGRVEVRVAGSVVNRDARPRGFDPASNELVLPIDLGASGRLHSDDPTEVEVVAYDTADIVASRPSVLVYTPPKSDEPRPPREVRVFGLMVGVSEYLGDGMDLRHAAADANAFGDALELAARGLVCAGVESEAVCDERVRLRRLVAERGVAAAPGDAPTRQSILSALRSIASDAGPDDIVVVFFAGHGVTTNATRPKQRDGRMVLEAAETFLFLTPDAGILSADALAKADGERATVSGAEVAAILGSSKARKQLLILDTCGSGGAADDLGARRTISGAQIRELDRTATSSGVWLLAGSAADAVSYEASRFGQGVLTYAMLEWLKGGDLRDGHYVDVTSWFDAAARRVPDLAAGIGGIQRPQVVQGYRPRERADPLVQQAGFAVGRLAGTERDRIELSLPRPVFVRTSITETEFNRDELDVAAAVDAALAEEEATTGTLTLWRVSRAAGAYQVTGRYTMRENSAEVTFSVLLGREKLATAGPFEVRAASGTALAQAIAERVMEEVRRVVEATRDGAPAGSN